MTLIFAKFRRQIFLVANKYIVNKSDSRNPVPVIKFAVSLDIVLTSAEIPHKITPVHEINLIVEKDTHILNKSRFNPCLLLSATFVIHSFSGHPPPLFLSFNGGRFLI